MASQDTRKPVLTGTGSAEYLNRGEAFNTAEYNELRTEAQQNKKLSRYSINANLLVMEVAYD